MTQMKAGGSRSETSETFSSTIHVFHQDEYIIGMLTSHVSVLDHR